MLIVGLGNPGAEYSNTRHNIGFVASDIIAEKLGFSWKESAKFQAIIASGTFESEKIIIAKPQTYMNLSGKSVSILKNYYNIETKDVLVFHDEIDIPLGELRYKQGGGFAGHNGLKSLDQSIGKDYHRIRIGVGRPEGQDEVSNYVLGHFTKVENTILEKTLNHIEINHLELIKRNFANIVLKSSNK